MRPGVRELKQQLRRVLHRQREEIREQQEQDGRLQWAYANATTSNGLDPDAELIVVSVRQRAQIRHYGIQRELTQRELRRR